MNKKDIKKLIHKEIKEKASKETFYSLFFIAITIFFSSVIELIIYHYNNSDYIIPWYIKSIFSLVATLSIFSVIYILLKILDKLHIRKNRLLYFIVVIPIVLIGLFVESKSYFQVLKLT